MLHRWANPAAVDAAAQPPWLVLVLAVITLLGLVVSAPAFSDLLRRRRDKEPGPPAEPPAVAPAAPPTPPQTVPDAMALVQDLVDTLQDQLARANRKIDELEAQQDKRGEGDPR